MDISNEQLIEYIADGVFPVSRGFSGGVSFTIPSGFSLQPFAPGMWDKIVARAKERLLNIEALEKCHQLPDHTSIKGYSPSKTGETTYDFFN